jgi:hypothetical protein
MEENQFSSPAVYLRDGFTGANGNPLAGINGRYSLGMAYRLLTSGVTAEEVSAIRKEMAESFENDYREAGKAPKAPLPSGWVLRLHDTARALGAKAAALDELFTAAGNVVLDWTAYALLIKHLERIHQQMTLIAAFRKEEPAHA